MDIITDSQPKLLLVGETTLPMAKQAASKCDYPQDLIYMIEKEGCNEIKSVWSIAGEEEFEPAKLSEREVKEMTAFLCYSSGTTDKAKGSKYFRLLFSINFFNLPHGANSRNYSL